MIYDDDTRRAITALRGNIDIDTATEVWEAALATAWHNSLVWVHGDISTGNLLAQKERLSAVIDFGQLAIGDPACDLAIAWTLFRGKSRQVFRSELSLDTDTWTRGRAWTLWKALIVASSHAKSNNAEAEQCWNIINEVLIDYKGNLL
jgi:aminoglycoside phosphotransferase (APT) family kinase protein